MAGSDQERDEAASRALKDKIEWLLQHRSSPGINADSSNAAVTKAISEATGEVLERSSVWKLRNGQNDNPKLKTLKALRAFFRLPTIGYFDDTEEAELIDDLTALLTLLEKEGVDRDTLRSLAELSDDGRATIVDMIHSVARREKQRSGSGTAGPQGG